MVGFGRKKSGDESVVAGDQPAGNDAEMEIVQSQPFWTAIMPVIACGAGLFSDGICDVMPLLGW